ncbi:MAG TPA: hypothetical protein VH639_10405 [Bryobacteraceae bacterium]|jgi:hypothetical protein
MGAFSVIDHRDAAALAADVLLYHRLLIPVPPDEVERQRWRQEKWDPDLQERRLKLLGDLAKPVEWNDSRQQTYALAAEKLRTEGKRVNGFLLTGFMIAKEADDLDVVAAYHSGKAFEGDFPAEGDPGRRAVMAYLLGQRFAVPKGGPEEALQKAVMVAGLPEFQEHRLALYEWQQKMIDKAVPDEEAMHQMAALLAKYNACVEKAVKNVYYKLAFTVAGVAIGMTAAAASPLAVGGALLTMARFAKFEARPVINAGSNGPAAMFHEFESAQKSFWDWTKHR